MSSGIIGSAKKRAELTGTECALETDAPNETTKRTKDLEPNPNELRDLRALRG